MQEEYNKNLNFQEKDELTELSSISHYQQATDMNSLREESLFNEKPKFEKLEYGTNKDMTLVKSNSKSTLLNLDMGIRDNKGKYLFIHLFPITNFILFYF